jgi:hypothetical protein
MKRKRPRQYSNSPIVYPKLRKRWRSWLPMMSTDLAHLLGRREIFWELQEIAKENSWILEHGAFFDWMCTNYVVTASIGIRSFTDQRKDVHSLWRMLFEMLEHPGVLSRSAHVALYKGVTISPYFDLANISFDNIAGKGKSCISQRAIRSDLHALEDSSERVRRFVNKRIAHRTPKSELRRLPKFHELDQAMDTIDRIFCRYNLILTARSMDTAHATRQDNWKVVLYEAWIKPGSKFLPEYYG